jgi:hypothetical protein
MQYQLHLAKHVLLVEYQVFSEHQRVLIAPEDIIKTLRIALLA